MSHGGVDRQVEKLLARGLLLEKRYGHVRMIEAAFDIVEVEGELAAKRGKLGGCKQVWRCPQCLRDTVQPWDQLAPECPECGGETQAMLKPLLRDGRIVGPLPEPKEIRDYALEQIWKLTTP